jgi:hypothetical protein
MSESISETIPKVLKILWDFENELRGAAQNSVVLRRDEARKHLADARRHLDELLGLTRSESERYGAFPSPAAFPTSTEIIPRSDHHDS